MQVYGKYQKMLNTLLSTLKRNGSLSGLKLEKSIKIAYKEDLGLCFTSMPFRHIASVQTFRTLRAYPGSEFVVANTLVK